ncbi:cellulose biosynthesis protein BcsN [Rhizobiaceae bacterium n13]|uniref:Cellulose biosynthesis protein BcsN n=1 Tax=Ferirhizobium litorale TaxID=2927786 RepID=A0AAE3U2D9_9HYPH|nr:cellulose biosynthesis protein BcsN [Fererhizobium litorale]MDI7862110.1 cellulose biosynthesis protein BcsN [Fererhizobium litorale]MDI7922617.1 cellulose biosynthesis protein BcsN [Fererhizobium litorale]
MSTGGEKIPTNGATVSAENALALPPAGGPAIVDIVERRYNNAVEQDILLFTAAATPGQNVMSVRMYGPVGAEHDGRSRLAYRPLQKTSMLSEIRRQFPGVSLRQSQLYLQNNYGPFSYAFGRGRDTDACLYAWQQVRSTDNERPFFQNSGMIQVRLRLCDADATEEDLLTVMYGYTISGTFSNPGWNPYGAPPRVPDTLGATTAPTYPKPREMAGSFAPRPVVPRATSAPAVERIEASPVPAPVSTVRLPSPATQDADLPNVVVPSPACAGAAAATTGCR